MLPIRNIIIYYHIIPLIMATVVGMVVGFLTESLLYTLLALFGWHIWQLTLFYQCIVTEQVGQNTKSLHGVWELIASKITKNRKLLQKSLRRKEKESNRYQKVLSELPVGLVMLGDNNRIIWFNRTAKQFLMLQEQDKEQPLYYFLRAPAFHHYLENYNEYDKPIELPSPADKSIIISLEITKLSKNFKVLMVQDISNQLRVDQMRRDFVSNVSHELRTPLTVIHGFIEALVDSITDNSTVSDWADSLLLMEQQSKRMHQLIDDLLLLAQLDNHQLQPNSESIDVLSLIENIVLSLTPLAEMKNVNLIQKSSDGCDIFLMGSERELYSAFYNLMVNAIRYSFENGTVEIYCILTATDFTFSVADNGIGIEATHIPRLTERFYRVNVGRSRESGGTGLGLAIVKHVLNRHDATLGIHSEVGSGSTFSCIFPLSRIQH